MEQKVETKRKRVNQLSEQSVTSKRKKSAFTVTLFEFVQIIYLIFLELSIDPVSRNINFEKPLGAYFTQLIEESEFGENKLKKHINEAQKRSTNNTLLSKELVQNVYNYVINEAYGWLEEQNNSVQQNESKFMFPKEMLKLFLATYSKCIVKDDFKNTSAIPLKFDRHTPRGSKNLTVLTNGSILFDYLKGVDIFIPNLARCESGDIKALKFIVENEIELSLKLFQPVISLRNFKPQQVVLDTESQERNETHSFIPLCNSKPTYFLVTTDIVIMHDGNHFSMPSTNNEREFNATMKKSSKLKSGEFLFLEVLFSNNRSKVIDLIACSIDGSTKIPIKYKDRLKLVEETLPDSRIVSYVNKHTRDCSYIQKPLEGFGTTYIHYKYNLTTAAVGLFEKSIVLAFLDPIESNKLVVKTRTSISGPSLISLYAMPFSEEKSWISCDGKKMEVVCDLDNVKLFEKAIKYEYKDASTKIGCESRRPVSLVTDFKTSTPKKDVATEDICKQFDTNRELLHRVIGQYAHKLSEDDKAKIKGLLDPDVQTSFSGYENN